MSAYTLYEHQQLVLDKALQGSHCIFLQMGLGKTLVGIKLAEYFKAHPIMSGKTLVVCPLPLIENAWMEDLKKFAPQLKAGVLWGRTPKQRKKAMAEAGNADLCIVNYESFRKVAKWALAQNFDVLILDESTKIKSPQAAISKAMLKFAPRIPRVYPLSGCPAPNSHMEYYNQVQVVSPNLLGGNFFQFRAKYFLPYGQNAADQVFDWRLIPGMLEPLMGEIKKCATFIRKEDAIELPPKTFIVRKTPLEPALREAYDEMVQHKILPLVGDRVAISSNALAELMKLRQITSGWVYAEDQGTYTFTDSKLSLLDGILEEIGDNRVVIWAQFRHDVARITDHLGDQAARAVGGMNKQDLQDNIAAFRSGQKPYLIAHPRTLGHGITLVEANYMVYYSLSYSLEEWSQTQERIHRLGQDKNCVYFVILAEDTIDETIYKALTKKEVMANAALQYLRAYAPSG